MKTRPNADAFERHQRGNVKVAVHKITPNEQTYDSRTDLVLMNSLQRPGVATNRSIGDWSERA